MKVKMEYKEACQYYCIGFACGLFAGCVAVSLSYIFLKKFILISIYPTFEFVTTIFALIGAIVMILSYTNPIWFYEAVEQAEL